MIEQNFSKNRRMISELVRGLQSGRSQGDLMGTNLGAIGVSQMPNGTFYDFDPPALGTYDFFGILVSAGPNGETDYTDARYYIRPVMVAQAQDETVTAAPTLRIDTGGIWIVGTNLQETAKGTHSLPVYAGDAEISLTDPTVTIVRVWQTEGVRSGLDKSFPIQQDTVTPGNTLYAFAVVAGDFFPVRVKQVGGSNGDDSNYASWTYDSYHIKDEDLATKLNVSAQQPECGRCRTIKTGVTQATNGSIGIAYRGVTGLVKLFDCQELYEQAECDEGEIDGGGP